jgi:hypothetical protein
MDLNAAFTVTQREKVMEKKSWKATEECLPIRALTNTELDEVCGARSNNHNTAVVVHSEDVQIYQVNQGHIDIIPLAG